MIYRRRSRRRPTAIRTASAASAAAAFAPRAASWSPIAFWSKCRAGRGTRPVCAAPCAGRRSTRSRPVSSVPASFTVEPIMPGRTIHRAPLDYLTMLVSQWVCAAWRMVLHKLLSLSSRGLRDIHFGFSIVFRQIRWFSLSSLTLMIWISKDILSTSIFTYVFNLMCLIMFCK